MFSSKKMKYIIIVFYFLISFAMLFTINNQQISDALSYHKLAKEVVDTGEFYPHQSNLNDGYLWPSLYINFLAVFYFIFGVSATVGKILNIILTLGQFIILYRIVSKFIKKEKNKVIWALFFILYPAIYFMNILTLTEPLFLFLLLLSFYFVLKIIKIKDMKFINFILSAIFVVLALLVRPIVIIIPFFTMGLFIYNKIKWFKIISYFLVILIVILAYGNWQKTRIGRFNAWGTTSGINLFREYNKYGTGRHNDRSLKYIFSFDTSRMDVFEKNKFWTDKALNWIQENPGQATITTIKKAIFMFMYDGNQIETAFNINSAVNNVTSNAVLSKLQKGWVSWLIIINQIIYGLLLILIIRGIFYLLKKRDYFNLTLLSFIPFLMFIVTLSASGSNRYHFVIILTSYPLIAFGLKTIKKHKKETQSV